MPKLIQELYVEFVKADRTSLSSATVATNVKTEVEAESPSTRLCGGFTEYVPTEPEPCGSDDYSSDNALILNLRFKAYEPLPYITKHRPLHRGWFRLSQLLHKTPDHESSLLDVRVLKFGMEYHNKDIFLTALNWYSFKNDVNYHVTKSRFRKFEGKRAM
ncbi:hypothetical protein PVK06_048720 [Gossypium arboreum]|uniref:Uncharacterized protein n=1 Tax=Gossypium arboreum TaxID=29729 RepID=A0ABR0MGN3_GOSAR|nr:hypothetical protein PVK06_048720 [Gossypium arboreum]